jgi:hypothetical protein
MSVSTFFLETIPGEGVSPRGGGGIATLAASMLDP